MAATARQVFVSQVIQGLARLVVGQMPARRCDALLDDVGIGAHLKHARIVVALQSQQVHAGKRLPGRIGHDTGVGHVAEGVATASALFEPKPVGIGRIVGSAEGTHGQAGQIEPIASVEGLERGADAGHSLAQRRGGREHRLAGAHRRMRPRLRQPAQDHAEPLRMVAMVVGDHDGPQLLQIEPGFLGPGEEVPLAYAAIDKYPLARRRILHNGGIPAAAAGQYMQSKH